MSAKDNLKAKTSSQYSWVGTCSWLIIVVISYIALAGLLAGHYIFGHKITAGEVIQQDLIAQHQAYVVDEVKTQAKLKQIIAAFKPVLQKVTQGTILVPKGSVITTDKISLLQQLGITRIKDVNLAIVIAVSLAAAFTFAGWFLFTYEPKLFFSSSNIALMVTVIMGTCAVALVIGNDLPALIPLASAALVFSVIYGRRVSTVLILLMIVFLKLAELVTDSQLIALSAGAFATLFVSVKKRPDLIRAGLMIIFGQIVGFLIAVATGITNLQQISLTHELVLQSLGGLLSAVVAIGSLPFLESLFGLLTPFRIIELADPDQPLMRQLEENAPGTYQHSLAVANLAEGGARAINADVYLARTGAMYHDIGKMVKPKYFIENQLGDKNLHDNMKPEESRTRVLAHVTDGLALAQKHGLPKAIQAFIPEHQGTTIIAFFYHKACLRDGIDNVNPDDYRYPGPKPQTKETAIVMLADVSEAVTHSMKDPSHDEVDAAMSSVFKARWEDGQFSECGLTLEELEKVKLGFLRVWRTLHHDRLKYPATTTGKMPVPPNPVPPSYAAKSQDATDN